MAFSYDLSTDRGKVRFELGDKTATAYVFEDDEIDYLLTTGGSVYDAVTEGLKVLRHNKAYRVKRATVHGLSIDDTAQVAALEAAIEARGGNVATVTVIAPSLQPFDRDYDPSTA